MGLRNPLSNGHTVHSSCDQLYYVNHLLIASQDHLFRAAVWLGNLLRYTAKSINLVKLCKSILVSNRSIQSVEVINKAGLTLEKLGSDNYRAGRVEQKKNLGRCLFDISLGEEMDDLYGPIQYNFSEGELSTLIFPLKENFVVVTTTKNISPISMATKVAQIINRSD